MMTTAIQVNGDALDALPDDTLLDIVVRLTGHELNADGSRADGGRLGVAVAVGGEVVPRSRWSGQSLAEGDEIEIVTAVQGG